MTSGANLLQLVGRERELEQLDAALDAVEAGSPGCLVLEGEPGIGKTRLLQALRQHAEGRGLLVLSGSAAEFERDMPFGVWVEALDAYVDSQDLSRHEQVDDVLLHELAVVLPSVRRNLNGATTDLTGERYRVHRAVRVLLELMAIEKSLVVLLDDLHWADPGSIDLIGSLLRRSGEAPILLALAYRTGQSPPKLTSSLAVPDVAMISVAPLTAQQAGQLAGEQIDPRLRTAIFAQSGGNPFYTLQLARGAELPARSPGDRATSDGGVPAAVLAALTEELQALRPSARTLLSAGAIAGDPFEAELAFAIAQMSEQDGVDALDELLDVALLRSTDVPRRFAFRHPLVRRAVYDSTKAGWRLMAHRRAAAALAGLGASPAAQAHHVEQSAAQGDGEAIDLLLRAGGLAAAQSPEGAARWYTAALRLMSESDQPARLDALTRLAACQRGSGDYESCCVSLQAAIEFVPAADVTTRVRLATQCAATELFLGRHDQAQSRLLSVSDALPDRTSREAVVAMLAQAMLAFFTKDAAGGCELAVEALEAARALEAPGLIGEAAATVAHMATVQVNIPLAETAQREAARTLDAMPDSELAGYLDAFHRLCRALLHLERYADARRQAERGLQIARATGQEEYVPVIMSAYAHAALMLGDLVAATEYQDAAVEVARLAGNDFTTCSLLSTTANIALLKGDLDAALRAGEDSIAIVGPSASGHIVTLAKAALAITRRETGASAADVESLVEPAGGWGLPSISPVWRVRHHEALTRIELAGGDSARAEESASLAERAAAELGLNVSTALAKRARAMILLSRNETARAAELALESADAAMAAGATIDAARSRLVAGQALAAAGDRADAVELLRETETALDRCGALRARNEARRELRKLGARAEPRGPATGADSGLAALTKRELEIAELVTQRKTNSEIATSLYLSTKTIESHLRNIFMKLNASSRVEVARTVERERRDVTPAR